MAENAVQIVVLGAMMLLGAGVLVGIGSSVTDTISDGQSTSQTVLAQAITITGATNNTAIKISDGDVASITALYNATYNFALPGNGTITTHSNEYGSWFTPTISCGANEVTGGNCSISAATSTNFRLNFTAAEKNTATLAGRNATSGINQLATQLPNIGLVLGASAILGIIFMALLNQYRTGGRRE